MKNQTIRSVSANTRQNQNAARTRSIWSRLRSTAPSGAQIALAAGALVMASHIQAQSIVAEWDLSGEPGDQASSSGSGALGLTVPDVSRGPGLTASAEFGSIAATGWETADQAADYYSFGFEVEEGLRVTPGELRIGTRANTEGPAEIGLFSSQDNFTNPVATLTQPEDQFLNEVVDLSSLDPITGAIEFRLAPTSPTATNGEDITGQGTYRITNYWNNGDTGSFAITGGLETDPDFNGTVEPILGQPQFSAITTDEARGSVEFLGNDGSNFTEHGFIIAIESANADPRRGDADADVIDFTGKPDPTFEAVLTGLQADTTYAARGYVLFDGGATESVSPVASFTTEKLPPALDGATGYFENFPGFTDADSLPNGWELDGPRTDYGGDWGTGFSSGLRGNATVLGYQHTGSTETLVKRLVLRNETGGQLDSISVSYLGKVERPDEGRSPAYTVTVDGREIPALAYDTNEGDGVGKSANVTNLGVAPGETLTLEWSSDRGGPSGSSKQIGLTDVSVSAGAETFPPAIESLSEFEDSRTDTTLGVDAVIADDGGAPLLERGFVIAETDLEPNPTLDTPDTDVFLFDEDDAFDGDPDFFFFDFDNLTPNTEYSIRAYAENSAGTGLSGTLELRTRNAPGGLTTETPFEANFAGVESLEDLPVGISVFSDSGATAFLGPWGSGNQGGFRTGAAESGEPDPEILGYQHTGGTGELTIQLDVRNDTPDPINALEIEYLGAVERIDQSRFPNGNSPSTGILSRNSPTAPKAVKTGSSRRPSPGFPSPRTKPRG